MEKVIEIKKIKLPNGEEVTPIIGTLSRKDLIVNYDPNTVLTSRFSEVEKILDETVKIPQLKSYVKKNDLQKQLNAMRWKMGGR